MAVFEFHKSQGCFKAPDNVTKNFAGMTYCARLTVLNTAWLEYDEATKKGEHLA